MGRTNGVSSRAIVPSITFDSVPFHWWNRTFTLKEEHRIQVGDEGGNGGEAGPGAQVNNGPKSGSSEVVIGGRGREGAIRTR